MSALSPTELSRLGARRRTARAELKQEIARGKHSLVALCDAASQADADPALSGLRVSWFLGSIPGVGVNKTTSILHRLGISPRATVGGLRVRQRAAFRKEVSILQRKYLPDTRGILIVLVGPTAVGKGTIVSWITSRFPDFVASVSATTRSARPGEIEGRHYFFVDRDGFDALIESKSLLEWAIVHGGHRYGTPRSPVEEKLDLGYHVILEIDIQGFRQVRRKMARTVRFLSVFVEPPSFEELERRLLGRATEDSQTRQRRLETARAELAAKDECDHTVVNDEVERAAQSIVDLVTGVQSATHAEENQWP